ncbi:hypothetical protein [Proteiniphilum acetatigenes]|uniref:hypothetical protein n=1 Tax=Proteiniphilum acetatigenes TaxID=294710 RepID=UPI00036DF222|nr:hypothetical protein [Proteiniphilum acetatigenes]
MTDSILYYPYISLPENLWTYRALLYFDNLGVIVPNDYLYNPEKHTKQMRDLIHANLVQQIDPIGFTYGLENFTIGFLEELLSSKRRIDSKQRNFRNGHYTRIHVEKFDNGLMNVLEELGLAKRSQDWAWYHVEPKTAFMLMTYLATIIAIQDNRVPVTDRLTKEVRFKPIRKQDMEKLQLRDKILQDILPLPSELNIGKLENFKGKYHSELSRFRRKVESLIIELNQYKGHIEDFEELYKIRIEEITDRKEFLASQMKKPGFGKIVFGSIFPLSASGMAIINSPENNLLWLIPSLVSTAYSVVTAYRQNEILRKEDFRYLALIDKKLSSR